MADTPTWTLYWGDALTVLRTLPEQSVDATVTDPPYNSGAATTAARSSQSARAKYVSGDAKHTLPDFPGDQRDQRGYLAWMTLVLTECLRAARPGTPLLLFSDWRQVPVNSDALQAAGWAWRGVIPWHKPIARPVLGGFRRSCEYVLWGTNGPIDSARNPVYLDGYITGSQPRGRSRVHITQKPLDVMRHLVKACPPGGTVLDPFTGSGTTGAAALAEQRSFIGIEHSSHYTAVARTRLAGAGTPTD